MRHNRYYHEDELLKYCKSKHIQYDAYSPFGVVDYVTSGKKWGPISLENVSMHHSVLCDWRCSMAILSTYIALRVVASVASSFFWSLHNT